MKAKEHSKKKGFRKILAMINVNSKHDVVNEKWHENVIQPNKVKTRNPLMYKAEIRILLFFTTF